MENNPNGEAPLTTAGEPTVVAPVESAEVLKARIVIAEKERDDAQQSLLKANRAIEAGKKFEKFEDFQKEVFTEIGGLKTALSAKDKDIEDLKSILATRSAITPNVNSQPSQPQPVQQASEEEKQTRKIFGLPS